MDANRAPVPCDNHPAAQGNPPAPPQQQQQAQPPQQQQVQQPAIEGGRPANNTFLLLAVDGDGAEAVLQQAGPGGLPATWAAARDAGWAALEVHVRRLRAAAADGGGRGGASVLSVEYRRVPAQGPQAAGRGVVLGAVLADGEVVLTVRVRCLPPYQP